MKKLSAFVCAAISLMIGPAIIMLTLTSSSAFAEVEYNAKLREDGKYCARIQLEGPGAMQFRKTKCRTLEEWASEGYNIKTLDGREVEI